MSGIVPGPGDMIVNETDKLATFKEFTVLGWRGNNKINTSSYILTYTVFIRSQIWFYTFSIHCLNK